MTVIERPARRQLCSTFAHDMTSVYPVDTQNDALGVMPYRDRDKHAYRIITDRFALPKGADLTACDPGKQTFCGGTWNTIRDNLDYIQNAGFTASKASSCS